MRRQKRCNPNARTYHSVFGVVADLVFLRAGEADAGPAWEGDGDASWEGVSGDGISDELCRAAAC